MSDEEQVVREESNHPWNGIGETSRNQSQSVSDDNQDDRHNVLILGGCGFIGRNLLLFLLNENLVRYVKIVDKITPIMAYLHPIHMACFKSPIVEFQQADLTKIDHVERIFSTVQFHFVFNLAAETRYGQAEHVYASRCSDLSYLCATKSLEFGVKRFVEVSTAFVYDHSVPNCDEASPIEPSIAQAKHKREAEIRLLELSRSSYSQHSKSMDIVILRPAIVYGIGDTHLLMTRIICATLYHYSLQESMNLPFSGTLGLSTVHIIDVCTAMWHCAVNHQSIPSGSIFNLCDKNETTQESFTHIISEILGVEYTYYGYIVNSFIRHRPHEAVSYVNYKHLKAWDQLCQRYHVLNTPLSPYITVENLLDHSLSVNGSSIESTGYRYRYPRMIPDEIKQCILFAIETGIFPPVIS